MRPFLPRKLFLYLINLLAGALLPLAFAPLNLYPLAFLCPAFALYTWYRDSARTAAIQGALFGIGFFGVGASWIYISIHEYGYTASWLAALFTGIFILFLCLFPALNAYLLRRWFAKKNTNALLLAFPTSWALLEWVRSWLFTGFPWLLLGYSQIRSPLAGFAPIISVYGISFFLALSAGLCVNALRGKKHLIYNLSALALIWLFAHALTHIHWTHAVSHPLKVSLVQGDIAQQLKWDPAKTLGTIRRYEQLTEKHWNADIIVWPEAAVPMWLHDAKPILQGTIDQAQQHHTALIMGVPIKTEASSQYYNAMIGVGDAKGQYYKRHLVPFGEYVPFQHWLRGLLKFFNLPMSNFSAGDKYQPRMQIDKRPIASAICYEIAYIRQLLQDFPKAELIITISDDAWFGNSWAPFQHLQIAQMRSLETGRYQVVATNNGITAIIGPHGHILKQAPRSRVTVLNGNIYMMQGITPLIELGIEPILIVIALLFMIALLYRPLKSRRQPP